MKIRFNDFISCHFSLNPRRPGDLKEAFNTSTLSADIVNTISSSVCFRVFSKSVIIACCCGFSLLFFTSGDQMGQDRV